MISRILASINQNKKRLIYSLALALVLISGCCIVLSDDGLRDFDRISDKGVLRVATNYNSIDYYISGDTAVGFQYDLINVLCDSLNLEVEWTIDNSLDNNIKYLLDGEVDLIARSIPVTTELREKLAFSERIVQLPQVLIQRKAEFNNGQEPIRNQLLLAGKTVYVPKNSPSILRINNLADEIADTIIVKQDQKYEAEQLLMMVAKADIDYAVCDLQIAKKNAQMLPEIDIKTAVSFMQLQAWAMRPSSLQLKSRIDSFLIQFLPTKDFRDIYRKYYK